MSPANNTVSPETMERFVVETEKRSALIERESLMIRIVFIQRDKRNPYPFEILE